MSFTIGIDEAGRGPLAGPVAIGLVRAAENYDFLTTFPGLNDSKKMTEKNRERIFTLLEERVSVGDISYLVAMPTAQQIDKYGIAVVIRTAIEKGLSNLVTENEPHKVWLDGSLKAPAQYDQETVIGGDALIPAIMLASVAAKVTRDRYMVEIAQQHPEYDFHRHKGYGTKAHYAAINEHGLCPIHRATFIHLDRPLIQE
ncbi:MAG: ribonuclease HII [Candidatus Paceibacterota bacterium]